MKNSSQKFVPCSVILLLKTLVTTFFKGPWIFYFIPHNFEIFTSSYWSMKVWYLRGRQPPKQRAPILWFPDAFNGWGWPRVKASSFLQSSEPSLLPLREHISRKNRELQLGIEPRHCEVSRRHFNCSLSVPDIVCTLRCREIFINVFLWRLKKNYFKVTEQRSPNYWFSPPNSPNSWGWARTNWGKIQSLSSTWMSGPKHMTQHLLPPKIPLAGSWNQEWSRDSNLGIPKCILPTTPNAPPHHLSPPEIKVQKKRNRPGFVTRRHGYVFWCLILINVWSWPSGFVLRLRPTKIYLLLLIPPKCPHSYIPHCRDRVL